MMRILSALSIAVLLLTSSIHAQPVVEAPEGQVPAQQIATFVWNDAHEEYAGRIKKLLDTAGIKSSMLDKPLTAVFVDGTLEDRARYILAQAIVKDNLDIHLQGTRNSDGAPCEVSARDVIEKSIGQGTSAQ